MVCSAAHILPHEESKIIMIFIGKTRISNIKHFTILECPQNIKVCIFIPTLMPFGHIQYDMQHRHAETWQPQTLGDLIENRLEVGDCEVSVYGLFLQEKHKIVTSYK